jgi:hypothetical protein
MIAAPLHHAHEHAAPETGLEGLAILAIIAQIRVGMQTLSARDADLAAGFGDVATSWAIRFY